MDRRRGVHVHTVDVDELVSLARSSLVRGLTPTECDRYGFDPCPTLSMMQRHGRSTVHQVASTRDG